MPSLIQAITEKSTLVRDANGILQTGPLLDTCRMVLPVIGQCLSPALFTKRACSKTRKRPRRLPAEKLGTAFKLVEYDISGNIQVRSQIRLTKHVLY